MDVDTWGLSYPIYSKWQHALPIHFLQGWSAIAAILVARQRRLSISGNTKHVVLYGYTFSNARYSWTKKK